MNAAGRSANWCRRLVDFNPTQTNLPNKELQVSLDLELACLICNIHSSKDVPQHLSHNKKESKSNKKHVKRALGWWISHSSISTTLPFQVIPQANAKGTVFCFWANEGMLDPAQMSHLWGPRAGNLEKIHGKAKPLSILHLKGMNNKSCIYKYIYIYIT